MALKCPACGCGESKILKTVTHQFKGKETARRSRRCKRCFFVYYANEKIEEDEEAPELPPAVETGDDENQTPIKTVSKTPGTSKGNKRSNPFAGQKNE
jgi:hypothetical protein